MGEPKAAGDLAPGSSFGAGGFESLVWTEPLVVPGLIWTVICLSFCTTGNETAYLTARGYTISFTATRALQAAGTSGLLGAINSTSKKALRGDSAENGSGSV